MPRPDSAGALCWSALWRQPSGRHQHGARDVCTTAHVMLGQIVLQLGVTGRSNGMKCDGILIGAKPVAFSGESYRSNTKAGISRTPLDDLTQKIGVVEQVRGPIEAHRL